MLGLKHEVQNFDPAAEPLPINNGLPGLLGAPYALADFILTAVDGRVQHAIDWAENFDLGTSVRRLADARNRSEAWIRHTSGTIVTALMFLVALPESPSGHDPAA